MHFVYYDGAFMPQKEAKIPLSDRGFLFGDGVYATICVSEGTPRFLESHLTRLKEQCQAFNLLMPPLNPIHIEELIRLNQAEQGVHRLKIIVTGGDEPALHLPKRQGRLLMTLKPDHPPSLTPLIVGVFPHPFHLCHASYKSLAHLNRFYVVEEAKRQGVDDCLTLTEKGIVLETAFGNICWIVDKKVFTPSRKLPLYFGVTISELIRQKEKEGYQIEEVEVTLDQLPKEGNYFRTNSMGGVRPIKEINRNARQPQLLGQVQNQIQNQSQ